MEFEFAASTDSGIWSVSSEYRPTPCLVNLVRAKHGLGVLPFAFFAVVAFGNPAVTSLGLPRGPFLSAITTERRCLMVTWGYPLCAQMDLSTDRVGDAI